MKVVADLSDLRLACPSVVAIGKFDGVHIGHQAVLRQAACLRDALRRELRSDASLVALSFDPLPFAFFQPQRPSQLINSPSERVALMQHAEADICVMQRFDERIAALSATDFTARLARHLRMVKLVVGQDFALGRDRAGTVDALQALGTAQGFDVVIAADVQREGQTVRSGAIRCLLEAGDMTRAAALLGRSHFASGRVEVGSKLARRLGFPTANLRVDPRIGYPQGGVYATRTWISDPFGVFPSVTNLGYRPTFNGVEYRIESHLLEYPRNAGDEHLYGQRIAVAFQQALRPEIKFDSAETLRRQVERDKDKARMVLADVAADEQERQFMHRLLSESACSGNTQPLR